MVLVYYYVKKKCFICGMIRSIKDLVNLEKQGYICFQCWNKRIRARNKSK